MVEASRDRLIRSIQDVLSPIGKAHKVLGWLSRWAFMFGFGVVAVAVTQWESVLLPQGWVGRVFLLVVAFWLLGLGIRAAYRLRAELEEAQDPNRVARRKSRGDIIGLHLLLSGGFGRYVASQGEESRRLLNQTLMDLQKAAADLRDPTLVSACSGALAGLDREDLSPVVDLLDKLLIFTSLWMSVDITGVSEDERKIQRAYFDALTPDLSQAVREALEQEPPTTDKS
jgi:hypothetical protein